jgi:phage tail sheath protein FI
MAFQVSPGVNVTEIDLTTVVPAVATTEGAIAGVFNWGPIEERVLVSSETQLVSRFGKPTANNFETFFAAANFLAYGNKLFVSRAADSTAYNAAGSASAGAISPTQIKNYDEFQTATLDADATYWARYAGALGNSLKVAVCDSANAFSTNIDFVSATISFKAQPGSNIVEVTSIGTGDLDNLSIGDLIEIDNRLLKISSKSSVTDGAATITVTDSFTGVANAFANGTINRYWEYYNDVSAAPGTSSFVATAGGSGDELHVLVIDEDGAFSGTKGAILERYENLSRATNAKGPEGGSIYYRDVINESSQYIYVGTGSRPATGPSIAATVAVPGTVSPVIGATVATSGIAGQFTCGGTTTIAVNDLVTITGTNGGTGSITGYTSGTVYKVSAITGTSPSITGFTLTTQAGDAIVTTAGTLTGLTYTVATRFVAAAGQFTCGNSTLAVNDLVTITGTNSGTSTITGYVSGTVYKVSAITGTSPNVTGFTLTTQAGDAIVSTSGTTTGLTFTASRPGVYETVAASILPFSNPAPLSLSLVGGTGGEDREGNIAVASLSAAWDKFKNAEEVDVSLLIAGKAVGLNGVQIANYIIDNIVEYRKDCILFVSPRRDDVVNDVNAVPNTVSFRNNLRSTSYAVLDSGYKYQYDRYNDVNRYVPLCGDIAGLCVRTDETRDPWFSPAGFNRGQIKNILKLAYNPDKSQRDLLYKNGVNPVVTFPGQGTVLYGDKTLLNKPSAFDRINVRRLFIVLEKAIATSAKFSLFEFNDEFTRAQFRSLVEPYLRDIQGRRGVYDFKVVCDTTNNTAEVIDRNEFIGDIYIKPARSINFIQLNFIAVRTGVEFSEVIGQF